MICEKCAGEVETVLCAHCGAGIVKLGPYCYACGQMFDKEAPQKDPEDDLDLSTRILCSDEACIGVVNDEGFCKVCGKPYKAASDG